MSIHTSPFGPFAGPQTGRQSSADPFESNIPKPGPGRKPRGFAAMDPALQREIASLGGRAAHEKGTAHEFTSENAREAGRKGGFTAAANRKKRLQDANQK